MWFHWIFFCFYSSSSFNYFLHFNSSRLILLFSYFLLNSLSFLNSFTSFLPPFCSPFTSIIYFCFVWVFYRIFLSLLTVSFLFPSVPSCHSNRHSKSVTRLPPNDNSRTPSLATIFPHRKLDLVNADILYRIATSKLFSNTAI